MTKDKEIYATRLQIASDPRSTHSPAERQAQFDLASALRAALGDMSFAVERINGLRLALDDRAAKLPTADPLRKRLEASSGDIDALRKKIVATKEGGAITGEQRLREYLTDLYGNVVFYEGPPSQTQIERADALARELADVVKDFDAWVTRELSTLNAELARKKLQPLKLLTRDEWDKAGGH
jgi:hypothetical protein